MTRVRDLHEKWMREAEYRAAYEKLRPEFESARRRAKARAGSKPRAGARKKPGHDD